MLLGIATGDALGVPYEFKSREQLKANPALDMTGFGTHNQPPGTWSDDSSLTFCLAEGIIESLNIHKVATNFWRWLYKAYWTPRGSVFDVGITTREAIDRLDNAPSPETAGSDGEFSNGNGSLMRILPLLKYTLNESSVVKCFEIAKLGSSITHRHVRSIIACFYYLEFAKYLLTSKNISESLSKTRSRFNELVQQISLQENEMQKFKRLMEIDIAGLSEEDIKSSGYVIDTLEASIWCLMTTNSYNQAVLKAVNLGDDTDTTAAVTGGLAGLYYGSESINATWLSSLARKDEIEDLANRLFQNTAFFGNFASVE